MNLSGIKSGFHSFCETQGCDLDENYKDILQHIIFTVKPVLRDKKLLFFFLMQVPICIKCTSEGSKTNGPITQVFA